MRREEGLLGRVLSLGPVAEQGAAEPGDEPAMACVELLGPRDGRPGIEAAVAAERLGGAGGQSPPPPPESPLSPLSSFESSP